MAGSRRYKIGDIFTRTTGLLQSSALKAADKPIWYDVYEAFPPLEPPRYERPKSFFTIKPIFYPEDIIRAKYYQKYGSRDTLNLNEAIQSRRVGFCQAFVEAYQKIEEETPHVAEDELMLKAERQLESQGIYLDFSRRPAQQPDTSAENAEETTPVPVGDLEVPDTLMKGFHLSNLFSVPSHQPPVQDLNDEIDDLSPDELEKLKRSVEEMNKMGAIMEDEISEELFSDDDEYEEVKPAKEDTKKGDPAGRGGQS